MNISPGLNSSVEKIETSTGRESEHTGRVWRHFFQKVIPVFIDFHGGKLMIVQTGTAHFCIVERKAEGLDQVELCS